LEQYKKGKIIISPFKRILKVIIEQKIHNISKKGNRTVVAKEHRNPIDSYIEAAKKGKIKH